MPDMYGHDLLQFHHQGLAFEDLATAIGISVGLLSSVEPLPETIEAWATRLLRGAGRVAQVVDAIDLTARPLAGLTVQELERLDEEVGRLLATALCLCAQISRHEREKE